MKEILTNEQVELEIKHLRNDPYVRLAYEEQRIKEQRKRALGMLKSYQSRGKQLAGMGVDMDNIEQKLFGEPFDAL